MANRHTTLTSLFDDIADAIREKTGSSEEIKADDFDTAIAAIPSGGGGNAKYWVAERYDAAGNVTAVKTKFVNETIYNAEFGATLATSTSSSTQYYYFGHSGKTLPAVGANISTYAKSGTLGSGYAISNAYATKTSVPDISTWLQQAYYISDWHSFICDTATAPSTGSKGVNGTNPRWCLYNKSGVVKYVYTSLANFKTAINNEQISEDEPLAIMIIASTPYSSSSAAAQTLTISSK